MYEVERVRMRGPGEKIRAGCKLQMKWKLFAHFSNGTTINDARTRSCVSPVEPTQCAPTEYSVVCMYVMYVLQYVDAFCTHTTQPLW